jgi:hypothetical protein
MEFNDLTDEQKAKAKAAKTPEELMALVKEKGIELTDEQLESVSGGWSLTDCPSVCTDNQKRANAPCLRATCDLCTMPVRPRASILSSLS